MKIPLSSMDYYFFRRSLYTIQLIFEYQGHLDIQQLTKNLEKTIRTFTAVGSRIKIISDYEVILETGHPISVKSRSVVDEPLLNSFSETDEFLNSVENSEDQPLVTALVTNTPTRSFVGFSFSHLLGDGASFFEFLDSLSKVSQSEELTKRPANQRELLQRKHTNSSNTQNLFEATGYIQPRPKNSPISDLETFAMTEKQLLDLRKQCADNGVIVSNNDILMAELAKRFHQYVPPFENKIIVRCPVDYRNILGLPSGYFGNAVRDAIAIFEVGEIESLPFHKVAARIRQSIQGVDRKSIENSLIRLDKLRMDEGIRAFENVGCPGLLVSNLSKFPMSKINLGLGSPIGFYHASLNPRLGLILPAADGVRVVFRRPG